MNLRVLKVGGNLLGEPVFVAALVERVAEARAGGARLVLVHGGGRAIARMQRALGLETVKVDGLRVTDEASLDVAEMVLSGLANKRLVASFVAGGVDALGLSGVDRGLVHCTRKRHARADLGFVGEVAQVRAEVLTGLLDAGVLPVVSPICLGPGGRSFNVNADEVASALALALEAESLDFVSDVPGVLVAGAVVPRLDAAQARRWIDSGSIHGGMVNKVQAALDAVGRGVPLAKIVDVAGLGSAAGTSVVYSL